MASGVKLKSIHGARASSASCSFAELAAAARLLGPEPLADLVGVGEEAHDPHEQTRP